MGLGNVRKYCSGQDINQQQGNKATCSLELRLIRENERIRKYARFAMFGIVALGIGYLIFRMRGKF